MFPCSGGVQRGVSEFETVIFTLQEMSCGFEADIAWLEDFLIRFQVLLSGLGIFLPHCCQRITGLLE